MRPLLLIAATASFWLTASPPASAAEPAYLDDRSSPETLVRSLYNAIDRKEYARAYTYFDPPPTETLETYAQGYVDTESVDVVTGSATAEGAAGSIYYSLPVAIRAVGADGTEQVFAGCYTLHFIQPSVQTEPYRPLFIEKGELQPADNTLEEALPASCGEGQPQQQGDRLLEQAKRIFSSIYSDICQPSEEEGEPESHTIPFNYPHDPADAPRKEARLFRFFCDRGAYNEIHAYLLANERGEILPLRFATPELAIQYENNDVDGAVEEMRIVGYTAEDLLVNSSFDPETLEITTNSKWRGVGDASSSGIWAFRSGAFSLVKYEVDASYDGEVNPKLMLDYHSAP